MKEILHTTRIDTPLGEMQAIASSRGLCALEFVKPEREQLLQQRLKRWFPHAELRAAANAALTSARDWLAAYFDGDFRSLPTIALDSRGTEFETRVWREMRRLKLGTTISYSALAAKVGSPRGFRAVGNASRRNSIALIVPCHRVVGASRELTGYGGGLDQKKWLIGHERKS